MVLLFSLAGLTAMAQAKKPAGKAPTQKELEAMMKEAQQAMNDLDPEAKRMMDSMGFKMPNLNTPIPKVGDKALAKAYEEEMRIVPSKDAARIARIAATPSEAALPGYLSKVNAAVVAKMNATEKAEAEQWYLKMKPQGATAAGNAAIGLWMGSLPVHAIYIMGKTCLDNPGDIDNLNNYSAMLSMMSAEQAAIPLIQLLNKKYPGNSTILNNLGQAWFGLGEIDKANKYLDSAIRIFSYHSQANYTKSLIEESKGNKQAALDAILRSAKLSYNSRKEDRMKKLGHQPSGKDFDFPFPMPQDPLGLEKFNWPTYPMDVYSCITAKEEWETFKNLCQREIDRLQPQYDRVQQQALEEESKRMLNANKGMQSGRADQVFNSLVPPFALQASRKLEYYVNDKDGSMAYRMEKLGKDGAAMLQEIADLATVCEKGHKQVAEKYDPQIGEGRPNPLEAYCNDYNKVSNAFLLEANSKRYSHTRQLLEETRKRLNNMAYYSQYTMFPTMFEAFKLDLKIKWLTTIANQTFETMPLGPFCKPTPPGQEEKKKEGKLQEFDDVACQYVSHSDLGIMEFTTSCSRLEGKLKLGNVEYSRKVDMDRDVLLAASLEVKLGVKKGWEKGPIAAEAGAELSGKVEWDDKSITNWVVKADAGVSVGSNIGHGDKSIEIAGATASFGMNAGPSLTGRGLLGGIDLR
ncbi:MAG TPA: hypothetical protein VLC98_12325 [Phnomibacter sp.]|nr:hypothetical protein [Phnomibacter sp.]